ncbi:barwin-like endoglucanase [Apiospora hydei]|uniref:Barwin-like endoglucanase n=1 Tax=Apiospora hydei TaxID=1337664 RepID=A0ABR1W9K3_9PEZI
MAGLAFITVITSFLAAMATAAPAAALYSGSMTYNPYDGNVGACGKAINNGDSTVAVAPKFFTSNGNTNRDPVCGKTITITYNGKSVSAQVWDKCPGCGDNDIDATPDLFTRLVGSFDPAGGIF